MKQKILYSTLIFYCLWACRVVAGDFTARVFEPSHPCDASLLVDSKHFVIVTASYNNALLYEGNLASILSQEYKNFEVIITDDCSPDGTGCLIEQYLEKQHLPCKVTLVKNHKRSGALQNIYRSIAWCNPADIIAVVDGDDRLAHPHVLTMLNDVYANPDVWMTHGRLQLASTGTPWHWQEPIPHEIIQNNAWRSYYTIATHLRTFYAWLFRQVKVKDLLYKGFFLPVAQDVAWTIPMMELCAHHHAYIDTVTYLYNDDTPLMDAKINRGLQLQLEQLIRAKPAYTPLMSAPLLEKESVQTADVVIYATDQKNNLEKTVQSVIEHVHGIGTLFIMTSESPSEQQDRFLGELQAKNPTCAMQWVSVGKNLKKVLSDALFKPWQENQYVLFVPDNVVITAPIDVPYCGQKLQQTHAYGFYFNTPAIRLAHKAYCDIDGSTRAWHFEHTPQDWVVPGTLQMALYQKATLFRLINLLAYSSFEDLGKQLTLLCDRDQIGLFKYT